MPRSLRPKPRSERPAPPAEAPADKLRALEEMLDVTIESKTYRRLDHFGPYPKQREFLDLGATKRERLLMAGNQLGKSETGAYETALHLTGQYPADWKGRRFDKPVRWWMAGETGVLVRDVQQTKLCGAPGVTSAYGTGMIPRDTLVDKSLSRGVTDAFDTIQVRHVSGGVSTATFKTYEQGREKFQGEPVDGVWLDEEPAMDIYSECLTRTTATNGMVYLTFTPLKGMSDVVIRYLSEPSVDRAYVQMVIDDALHIPAERRQAEIDKYPAHEREARARGVPMLGSGRIFQIAEQAISEPGIEFHLVPPHWYKLWALDFGIDHPFAAVLMYWDKDADVVHVAHVIRVKDQFPLQHAQGLKLVAGGVPVAWPHDGNRRDMGGAGDKTLSQIYKSHGLLMLSDHAAFPDGGNSTEAGIMEMNERMQSGRFKVAAHLSDWFEEFRMYHRKDGVIVKERDDIMSATRIGVMAKRFARQVPLGPGVSRRRTSDVARDVDFDVFA